MSDKLVTNALVRVIEECGLEAETKAIIEKAYLESYNKIKEYEERVKAIKVTDESQTDLMAQAKELRLELRPYRINAEKVTKTLKAGAIKYNKGIQNAFNEVERLSKEYEEYLKEQEDFSEIQAMKRAEVFRKERQEQIQQYSAYVPLGIDLGYLGVDDFSNLFNGAKMQYEATVKKAEEDAIAEKARLDAEKIEIAKLRAETDRLKEQLHQENLRRIAEVQTVPIPVAPLITSDEEYLNDLANRLHQYPSRVMNTPECQKIYDAVKAGMSVIADEIIKSLAGL